MAKQPRILVGQVAAITGGGRGIGRATARALAQAGVKVAIGDLDVVSATKTAEDIGAGAIGLGLDVTDRDSFAAFIAQAEEQLGPIDIMINNAGIMPIGRFVDEDFATTKRSIDINIYGVHYGCELDAARPCSSAGAATSSTSPRSAGKAGYPGDRHLLRHEALRRRHERGAPLGDARHRRRGLVRDARSSCRPSCGSGLRRRAASSTCGPRTSPTRSCRRCKHPRFDVYVPRSVGPLTQFSAAHPAPRPRGDRSRREGRQGAREHRPERPARRTSCVRRSRRRPS